MSAASQRAASTAANSRPPASVRPRVPGRAEGRRRLSDVLLQTGVVDMAGIERALAVQAANGGRLGKILIDLGLCTEEAIQRAVSAQIGVEMVRLEEVVLDRTALGVVPRELMLKYEVIPLRLEDDVLVVATPDPFNLSALDDIRFATGRKLVVKSCTEADFTSYVANHIETQSLMQDILDGEELYEKAVENLEDAAAGFVSSSGDEEVSTDLEHAGEQPIITLCNFLLVESIHRGASDIHIEPYETYLRIRFRIDGTLQNLLTPPQRLHSAIVTRMKILAGMDIAQHREPEDGHIAIRYGGETCHYRVSTLPTLYGEKCVIRLLKKDEHLASIGTLGFEPGDLTRFQASLRRPQGIVLVTGPTGSGKTTTLHAGLSLINEAGTNIVTLEDPVEASIPGVNHVQINESAGLTFAAGLRSVLRQDPDIVFVGEIRDGEVADIAVKAALTGHLVLSTLHTNSASESLLRLADLGVAPYLIANALSMIVAQRLMRKVCDDCATTYVATPEEIAEFELTDEELATARLRTGRGCERCYNTGYRGRTAVYEVLRVTNEMRTLIRQEVPPEALLQCAEADGMTLLYRGGITKVLRGETTFDEVRRRLTDAR